MMVVVLLICYPARSSAARLLCKARPLGECAVVVVVVSLCGEWDPGGGYLSDVSVANSSKLVRMFVVLDLAGRGATRLRG